VAAQSFQSRSVPAAALWKAVHYQLDMRQNEHELVSGSALFGRRLPAICASHKN
jgi:hypothetical protein